MDYQHLTNILPKKSQQWSCEDTSKWLQFINLPNLVGSFKQASIDGSCIHLLDDETLKNQLNIASPIIRKKLLNWITLGLQGFDKHIGNFESKLISHMPSKIPQLKKAITTSIRQQTKSKPTTHSMSHQSPSSNQSYLMLQQFEGNSLGYYIIKNQTMTIGFGKNNHIHSLQASISEKHALIGYKNNGYFIQDLGSKYGTFIKINHRTLLKYGMILEIGSYQFVVTEIDHINQVIKLKSIYFNNDSQSDTQNNKNSININGERDQQNRNKNKKESNKNNTNDTLLLAIDLKAKSKYTFGRRKQNDFQRDDKHMSGIHSKITFFNNNFYIEDYGSTNGTWIRISPQFLVSSQHPIANQSIIKLGTAITYICRINQKGSLKQTDLKLNKKKSQTDGQMVDQNTCRICGNQQSNCLFLPCSHNLCCIQCSKNVGTNCFECYHQIAQKIKIHK